MKEKSKIKRIIIEVKAKRVKSKINLFYKLKFWARVRAVISFLYLL